MTKTSRRLVFSDENVKEGVFSEENVKEGVFSDENVKEGKSKLLPPA